MVLTNSDKRKIQIESFKKQIYDVLEKSSMNNIISIDETNIDSHICSNYGWSKSGTRIQNTITHPRIRYSLILAISCKKIIHQKLIKGSVNGEIFLEFIKGLVEKLKPNENNYILLDNARIHHYKKINKFILSQPKIFFIYNIPYTPETNPIEKVFNDIKRILRNKKINNTNLISQIKKTIIYVSKNNNFEAYYKKSLLDDLGKVR